MPETIESNSYVDLYHQPNRKKWLLSLIFILLPYYLNDIIYLQLQNQPNLLYPLDYGLRFGSLLLCYLFFGKSGLRLSSSVAPKEKKDLIIDILLVPILFTCIYLFIDFLSYVFVPKSWSLGFAWPKIQSPILRWLDLTIGLCLVSITEELVFRRHVYAFFGSLLKKDYLANIIQAILFGLIHWGSGPRNTISAIIFGLLAGVFYDRKKYLLPIIIFHTFSNFIIFMIH